MRSLLLTLWIFCNSPGSYSQTTDSKTIIADSTFLTGYPFDRGTVQKTYRKNGTVKKEVYDNWNGNRVYIRYVGKKKMVQHRYDSRWARNSLPPCR